MRNGSKGGSIQLEEVYQYIGNKIILLDSRDVTSETLDFIKTLIDPYQSYNSVVLNMLVFTPTRNYLYQVNYGTYADRRRIAYPGATNYIQYVPTYSTVER